MHVLMHIRAKNQSWMTACGKKAGRRNLCVPPEVCGRYGDADDAEQRWKPRERRTCKDCLWEHFGYGWQHRIPPRTFVGGIPPVRNHAKEATP